MWTEGTLKSNGFNRFLLRWFRDAFRIPRIENRVPRVRENWAHRIREIGSPHVHTRFACWKLLIFSTCAKIFRLFETADVLHVENLLYLGLELKHFFYLALAICNLQSLETWNLRDRDETWNLRDRDSQKWVLRRVSRPRPSLEDHHWNLWKKKHCRLCLLLFNNNVGLKKL